MQSYLPWTAVDSEFLSLTWYCGPKHTLCIWSIQTETVKQRCILCLHWRLQSVCSVRHWLLSVPLPSIQGKAGPPRLIAYSYWAFRPASQVISHVDHLCKVRPFTSLLCSLFQSHKVLVLCPSGYALWNWFVSSSPNGLDPLLLWTFLAWSWRMCLTWWNCRRQSTLFIPAWFYIYLVLLPCSFRCPCLPLLPSCGHIM